VRYRFCPSNVPPSLLLSPSFLLLPSAFRPPSFLPLSSTSVSPPFVIRCPKRG
jgi:hypothetical protein